MRGKPVFTTFNKDNINTRYDDDTSSNKNQNKYLEDHNQQFNQQFNNHIKNDKTLGYQPASIDSHPANR